MYYATDPDASGDGIRVLEAGRFRWTDQVAKVHLRLPKNTGVHLTARFWTAEEALKSTGPIEVTFRINGHEVARLRYTTPGEQHFDAPVPAEWLIVGPPNEVELAVDRTYIVNGVKLGVALAELGFAD
jgi:hypothetical protein